ncbi:MAG: pyrroline-5-carboxylate reductase [Clostridia bacterium]|nr:pyrroline-5-carboxylate reductase [Deltaproteobacteria bacterium]
MSLSGRHLALLGAGNMGEALLRGLIKAKLLPASDIVVTAPRLERRDELAKNYGVTAIADNVAAVTGADVILFGVKPQILDRVLVQVASAIAEGTLVISVAAGVTIEAIEARLGKGPRIIRAMPNTPAIIGLGATALAMGPNASADDETRARTIFEAVGYVTVVEEYLLDAVTGLSGSGPAYVFMIIEALSDAGVKVGLPRRQAQALAAQTVLGSAKLLLETGLHPGVLKDQVTSPGGTAIVGLHTLEQGGLRTTLINAVVAATHRSIELGKPKS